jgi:LysM repeat protein
MKHTLATLLTVFLLLAGHPVPAEATATSSAPQVHVVKPGDTLYEIARRHGLTVDELKRLNGLSSSRLKLGQKLALTRAAAPPVAQSTASSDKSKARKVTSSGPADNPAVHVVKRGDTLSTIARRHGLTVETLKQLNSLANSRLKVGQRLALTGNAGAAPPSASRSGRSTTDVHVVKKGETLFTIARRHGVAIEDLKRINDLTGSQLKVGQRLALAGSETEASPLFMPGDASEDEVLELTDAATSELEQVAFGFLSTPYRFGGSSRKGIDCSAFVQQVFREVDVDLPRSAREQYRIGTQIDRTQLQKGDLIFFRTYAKYPSHVGIYLGDGKMIHASSRSHRVVVTSIDYPYYRKRFLGAKRISLLDGETSTAADNETTGIEANDLAAPVESTSVAATAEPALDQPAGTVAAIVSPSAPEHATAQSNQ